MRYTIIRDGIPIGNFQSEHDRNAAFDTHCNDVTSSYLKGVAQ